jgi:hypothetical protein
MFRLARRGALAALLGAVLALTACTGNTSDVTLSTGKPVVEPTQASSIATTLLSGAAKAQADTSETGKTERANLFAGTALEAADARATVLAARSEKDRTAAELSTSPATILGVSSESKDTPAQILAQTSLKESGASVLALLVGDPDGQNFRIVALTPMVEGATLDALDPASEGSGLVGDGSGLVAQPKQVVQDWAASVAYPDPTKSALLAADPWSDLLRKQAQDQAKAIGAEGLFVQTHVPGEVLGGLRLKGGVGAVVFANVTRTDAIALHKPSAMTPAKDVTALTGIKKITTEVKLVSSEFVAFVIPATGQVRLIAARDQLTSAEAH